MIAPRGLLLQQQAKRKPALAAGAASHPHARRRLAWLALIPMAWCLVGAAQISAAEKKEDEKAKVTLSPELETKLTEFVKKAAEVKRKLWAERMKKEIERVAKVTDLDADGSKVLDPVAGQAIDASLVGWSAKLSEAWRKYLAQFADQPDDVEQMLAQVEQAAQTDWFGDYLRPFDHPKWTEELTRVLTPQQASTWEKTEAERKRVVSLEIGNLLKTAIERTRDQQERALLAKGEAIKATLALPNERAEKLDALAKTVARGSSEELGKRGERTLLAMEEDQRRQAMKTGRFHLSLEVTEVEAQQTAWKDGVARLLTPEELGRWQTTQTDSKSRRAAVLGRILLSQLDDQVAFTASQRERLQPIAERLVKAQDSLFPDANVEGFQRLDLASLFAAGTKADETEMKAILDETQWKRWKEACLGRNNRATFRRVVFNTTKAAAGAKPAPRVAEPEELEHAISDHLHEKAGNERKRLLGMNLLKAEDAARVVGLGPEAVARLATAARGATEETLALWKQNTEQNTRGQLREVTADNVKLRLASMETYSYDRGSGVQPAAPAVWEETVKSELTEAQRAAWQKEIDLRTAYRDKTIAATIMSEFDRRVPLTPEQWGKLEPRVEATVRDYSPDIGRMFSYNYPYAWYLQSYSMFIPIAAIPEQEIKELLTKKQWDTWTTTGEFSNVRSYWENVQSYHTQRMKEKKR